MRQGSPDSRHESFPQVSTPNSPSCGTTLKVQSSSPLRTSYPRRFSGAFPFQRIPESPAPSSTPRDHDHVVHDDGTGAPAEPLGRGRNQVDPPAVAEIGTGVAGLRVEGVEIAATHVDQAPVGAVAPVVHPP